MLNVISAYMQNENVLPKYKAMNSMSLCGIVLCLPQAKDFAFFCGIILDEWIFCVMDEKSFQSCFV